MSTCSACWKRPRPRPSAGTGDQLLRLRAQGPCDAAPLPRAGPRRAHQQRLGLLPRRRAWLSAYVSSKFAVRGFSEALRQELADLPNVHICTVSPSPIDTPIFASAANYSGRAVKAPPPTYPPQQVASAILASALHPKRERIVGGAGRLVTLAEAVAPRRSSGSTAAMSTGCSSPSSQPPPPTATCTHPSPTATLRSAAAGGAGPTRRPICAG